VFCHLECYLDICFVIDHSGSIRDTNVGSEDNWVHVIDFMVKVVSEVNVGPDKTHVGAVSFGNKIYPIFIFVQESDFWLVCFILSVLKNKRIKLC